MVVGQTEAPYSVSFQPAPSPRTNRPPLISATVAAIFAISPGGWKLVQATSGPSSMRSVTAASPASMVQTSHGPRSSRPSPR